MEIGGTSKPIAYLTYIRSTGFQAVIQNNERSITEHAELQCPKKAKVERNALGRVGKGEIRRSRFKVIDRVCRDPRSGSPWILGSLESSQLIDAERTYFSSRLKASIFAKRSLYGHTPRSRNLAACLPACLYMPTVHRTHSLDWGSPLSSPRLVK